MKRFIVVVALLCAVCIQANSQQLFGRAAMVPGKPATTCSSFAVQVLSDSTAAFILKIDNPQNKKLDITIRHSMLGIALDTTLTSAAYACRYRFDHAEDGKYTIKVSNGRELFTREIELSTTQIISRRVTVL